MEQIRAAIAGIAKNLGALSVTQKLLIGSLVVVMLMTLFLVSQYAGSAKMAELMPGASADAIGRAKAHLDTVGIPNQMKDGKLMVAVERHLAAIASLGESGKLPEDASLTFTNYIEKQNWMNPKSENDRIFNTALENTLAQCVRKFRGIESATVVIDVPEQRGIGAAVRKPTATVVVFTKGGSSLDAGTVDAIAATVAGAKAGLEAANVNITDGTTGRKYAVRADGDLASSSYIEHVAKFERYVQEKIEGHLSAIRGVSVAVSAQVDVRRSTSRNRTVKPKGKGSEAILSKETTSGSSNAPAASGGEPGIGANTRMDIRSETAGSSSKEETGETEFATQFGMTEDQVVDPHGMPTKINATIGVPRDYVVKLWEQGQAAGAAAAPTDADLKPVFEAEKDRIEKYIAPLIETDARAGGLSGDATVKAGTVVVSMIPFAVVPPGGSGGGGGSAEGAGMLGGGGMLAVVGWLKPVLLGGLALMAMALMAMMLWDPLESTCRHASLSIL